MTKEEHAKVLDALETCKTGGYRDIDGDWCKRQVFDENAVDEAIAIMRREPISDAEKWKQAVMLAYGHLWHVNNEPMAPIPMRSPEKAAYAARKVLLDLLTHEERGLAINEVRALLEKAR